MVHNNIKPENILLDDHEQFLFLVEIESFRENPENFDFDCDFTPLYTPMILYYRPHAKGLVP